MILLVDDNKDDAALILRSLKPQLSAGGIRHVTDGDAAMEFLQQRDGQPLQLILLDLHMPTLPGFDVLKRLRSNEHTRRTPVVIVSGSDLSGDVARSYDLGANSFINKNDQPKQFAETVRQVTDYWLTLNYLCPLHAVVTATPPPGAH